MFGKRINVFEELVVSLKRHDARLLVGIDVAKQSHMARVEHSDGTVLLEKVGIANSRIGFESFWLRLEKLREETGLEVVCALEASGGYQKLIGNYLVQSGYTVVQVSGVVANRNRRTIGGSWLKTDPRDAQNLVDLLRQGKIVRFESTCGVLEEARQMIQYDRALVMEASRLKVRIRNRFLSVGFPEVEEYFPDAAHPDLLRILRGCPSARDIALLSEDEFFGIFPKVQPFGRKADTLREIHGKAKESIGMSLEEGLKWECCRVADRLQAILDERENLKEKICKILSSHPGYLLVQTIPAVGKLLGAIFVVEIGDPTKYRHWRQVIKLAGLDLAVVESGQFSGTPRITRQGKALLRWAAYQAAVIASSKDMVFHQLYMKAIENRAGQRGAKKRALIKIAAKILRIVYAVLRGQRAYAPELLIPA